MDIEKWKNTKEVLNSCTFVVFNRGEFNRETLKSQKEYLENKYQAEIVLLDIMSIDISSTIIRKRIKEGKRVDFFLPNKVLEYINKAIELDSENSYAHYLKGYTLESIGQYSEALSCLLKSLLT